MPRPQGQHKRQGGVGLRRNTDQAGEHSDGARARRRSGESACRFEGSYPPGSSPHQALDALAADLYRKRVNWIVDADIQGFFDNLSHEWMLRFLEHRIADTRILRLIQKWLKAGVSEDGEWREGGRYAARSGICTMSTTCRWRFGARPSASWKSSGNRRPSSGGSLIQRRRR